MQKLQNIHAIFTQNSRRYSRKIHAGIHATFSRTVSQGVERFSHNVYLLFFDVVSPLTDSIFKQLLGHTAVNGAHLVCMFDVICGCISFSFAYVCNGWGGGVSGASVMQNSITPWRGGSELQPLSLQVFCL
jgi:hypothetical protein